MSARAGSTYRAARRLAARHIPGKFGAAQAPSPDLDQTHDRATQRALHRAEQRRMAGRWDGGPRARR